VSDFWETLVDFVAAEMRGKAWEQERIIKRIREEFPKLLKQHGLVIIPEVFDYFIEQIKQDKMSDPSDKLDTPEE
jgi:hypothetical protein